VNHPNRSNVARFEPVPGIVVAGKYRVERVLGEGGMGVVVAATHLGLDQRVAIKFLLPEAMRHKEAVERFQREAIVAAKVKSEHVARVHDVGEREGGEPFIVMEYLEGSDLRQLIKEGPLPVGDACEIVLQACEALAEVHAAGIVHRDLKPSNLFVTRRADGSPCVKLLDFGISKFDFHGGRGTDPALTATATIMGSPSYMSPEQIKSTKEVDARSDVWSLGVVLYEAITGRPAFRGENVPQVCAMIVSADPPLPSSLREGIPIALDRAIVECLQKSPEKRAHLVDLARTLVEIAPDRARVSLERLEAVLGETAHRPQVPAGAEGHRDDDYPVRALSASGRGPTPSRWGREKREKRGSALPLLVLLAASALAIALYSGRVDVTGLRGQIAGATSAVASAVGSSLPQAFTALATPSASAAPGAIATSTATATATPTDTPSSSNPGSAVEPPSNSAATDEMVEPDEPPATGPSAPSATAPQSAHLPAASHTPAPTKHHTVKHKHGGHKLHKQH
jgi:serine/threonine protein kinase